MKLTLRAFLMKFLQSSMSTLLLAARLPKLLEKEIRKVSIFAYIYDLNLNMQIHLILVVYSRLQYKDKATDTLPFLLTTV